MAFISFFLQSVWRYEDVLVRENMSFHVHQAAAEHKYFWNGLDYSSRISMLEVSKRQRVEYANEHINYFKNILFHIYAQGGTEEGYYSENLSE